MNEYSTDEVNAGVPDLVARCAALELQLAQLHAASDAIFAAYHEILALFDCPAHGECAPYAIQKIKEDRALLAALESEVARLRDIVARDSHEIEQILGEALHYPVYGPEMGGTGLPGEDVCVGEHVPASLAMEAAGRIEWGDALRARLESAEAALRKIAKYSEASARRQGGTIWTVWDIACKALGAAGEEKANG